MTEQEQPIHQIIQTLKSLGLSPILYQATKEVPCDVALTPLGMNDDNHSYVLQVLQAFQEVSLMGMSEKGEDMEEKTKMHMLSFILPLSVEIPKEKEEEVLRLLALANKSMPLGHINYSELEKSAYFHYGLSVFSHPPCEKTVWMILEAVMYAVDTFFPLIVEIAASRETLDSLLQETE